MQFNIIPYYTIFFTNTRRPNQCPINSSNYVASVCRVPFPSFSLSVSSFSVSSSSARSRLSTQSSQLQRWSSPCSLVLSYFRPSVSLTLVESRPHTLPCVHLYRLNWRPWTQTCHIFTENIYILCYIWCHLCYISYTSCYIWHCKTTFTASRHNNSLFKPKLHFHNLCL